ncbi:MAG: collagen binding domain-containing protein, partial [Clostridia bacterium]
MKTKKIFMCLILLFGMVIAFNTNVNAETLPDISDVVNSIEPYNNDGTSYPDLRNRDMTVTIYAYLNPRFGHGSQDNPSLPEPFNKHYTYSATQSKTFYTGAFSNGSGYDAYLFYCVGYGMPLNTSDKLLSTGSVYGWNDSVIDDRSKDLVSLALIYGFDSDPYSASSIAEACLGIRNTADGKHVYANAEKVFATQVATWMASTGKINTAQEDEIARYLFEIDGVVHEYTYSIYLDIMDKIKKAMKMPTYASTDPNNAPVYELSWNPNKSRFEYTMTDDNQLGLNGDKITITHKLEGTGLNCEVNGNQVTIYTNSVVGTKENPVRVAVQKDINNGRGVAGFWQKAGLTDGKRGQPLTRLVDDARTPEFAYYSAYTKGYKIRIHKTLQSTTGNLGNASVKDAVYGIYSDSSCQNEVARVIVGDNGYSNKTEYLSYQTYYAKEIYNTSSTQLDTTVYTIDPSRSATDSDGDYGLTLEVSDWVNESTIKITKKLGETDYDPEINLAGCKFKITLDSDTTQVYYTNVSGADGICEARNVPFGQYTVSEVQWPDEAYKVDDFPIDVKVHGKVYETTKVDPSKEMQIEVEKVLLEETRGKTDAKVSGAYFTIYTDEAATIPYMDKNGKVVRIGPTNASGYAISGTMRTGTYYLKETTFPEGINPDAIVPGESITFREKIYKASYNNAIQGTNIVTISINSIINIPNLGSIDVIKYDNNPNSTDEQPAKGAILALTLKSNKNCVYYATIDENGHAEFINEDLKALGYDYTIPYGEYEITETEESKPQEHTSFYFQPETVIVRQDTQKEYRVFSDEPVPAWPKIIKKDKDSGNTVKLEGAKYKIWDTQNN